MPFLPCPVGAGFARVDLLPVQPVHRGRCGVCSGRHLCHPFSGRCCLPGRAPEPVGGGRGLGPVRLSRRLWRYDVRVLTLAL